MPHLSQLKKSFFFLRGKVFKFPVHFRYPETRELNNPAQVNKIFFSLFQSPVTYSFFCDEVTGANFLSLETERKTWNCGEIEGEET